MNKQQWLIKGSKKSKWYRQSHKYLHVWMQSEHITELCDVHHRDDNEEVRAYNEAHYERWGCEEDGTFIEGKYVQFLTRSEHMRYHGRQRTGEKNPFYGKHYNHTEEAKQKISENHADISGENNPMFGKCHMPDTLAKMSESHKGWHPTAETKQRLSENRQMIKCQYQKYKVAGGNLNWNEFQRAFANNEIEGP